MLVASAEISVIRDNFFRMLFGQAQGYICVAFMKERKKDFREVFFRYPEEMPKLLDEINIYAISHNVYFCPQLLAEKRRTKETVKIASNAWADLDECDPSKMRVEPTIVMETSAGRYQALWCFDRPVDPADAEDISRRIAYTHANDGADRSGWDLSQLLRVPSTYNTKYEELQTVQFTVSNQNRYRLSDFTDAYPQAPEFQFEDIPMPEEFGNDSGEDVLQKHRLRLTPSVWRLFTDEPEKDWSGSLWRLELGCFESGMNREEVFIVARDSACNKYKRDGRDARQLWREICRAFKKNQQNYSIVTPSALVEVSLLTDEERAQVESHPSYVERYIDWARALGDAAWQYHQAGAFISLSSLMCGGVVLPTSFGNVVPNLWFMILADSTITRKSTAMDIAMDLVTEIDPDIIMATDGSIEGLLTSMSTRPGRPSVFLRDEFSGLLESIVKKDYYAGMAELFTKLYDGKMQKRILRKESIEVRDPRLVVFAGGIKNRVTQLLTYEHVSSGFIPRFVFITAESDMSRLKPLGPPTERDLGNRDLIRSELQDMYKHYNSQQTITVNANKVASVTPRVIPAVLTDDAWVRYNQAEAVMVQLAVDSDKIDIYAPTYDRLSKSMLKASVLLAASRQRNDKVIVEEEDVCRAIYYMEGWRSYVVDVLNNLGRGAAERQMQLILNAIMKKGSAPRSYLMQAYHLNSRDTDMILSTLEQRGQITRGKVGKGEVLYAVGVDTART